MITTLSIQMVNPVLGGYAASKRSLTSAAQTMARELGPHAIRVNCVAPGHIWGTSLQTYFEFLAARRGITAAGVDRAEREEGDRGGQESGAEDDTPDNHF